MKKIWSFLFTLPLSTIATLAPITIAVAQQVSPDGTVSTTVITPDGRNFTINDGTTRGGNLFHSFKEFSVPTGGSANFNNALDVQNIIGRVTGNSVSNIDGVIRALGKANLFLLNPNGIIFGPNASLQIGGSFLGSTANSFLFDNGFEFSATDPQAPPLLTINVPIGLGFRNNPGNITTESTTNEYARLQVPSGKTITLVGGNVSLDSPDLVAPGGRIELGGLSTAGTVGLNGDGSLSFPVGVQRGDVSLTNRAFVDVSAGGGGSIAVNARNLDISGRSGLYAGINQGFGSVGSQAGDITLNASGTTTVANSFIYNYVASGAVGNSGNLTIETQKLTVSDGAEIGTFTFSQGNAGNLTVNASESVEVVGKNTSGGSSFLGTRLFPDATGRGGDLTIKTKRLSIRDGGLVTTSTFGNGDAGNLLIQNADLVEVLGTGKQGESGTLAADNQGGTGKGGDLTINTKRLVVQSSQVTASTFGQGNAGNLTVNASDSIELSGVLIGNTKDFPAGLFAQVDGDASGQGGNLTIKTGRLSISDGAKVQVATFAQGNAGNLTIDASEIDIVENPRPRYTFFAGGISGGVIRDIDQTTIPTGNGGRVKITTNRLTVRDGGRVTTSSQGQGDAGTLEIYAKESVEVVGKSPSGNFYDGSSESEISAAARPESTGSGGSLRIDTPKLIVRDGGTVTVRNQSNESIKPAGNLEINARSISLDNQGSITATTQSGNGGNIILGVQDFLLLRRNSNISTSAGLAGAGGDGGNITINSPLIVAFPGENSDITANAFNGSGGKVTINTSGLFGIAPLSRQELEQRLNTTDPTQLDPKNLPTNDITAISQNNPNLSGTINIITPDVDPSRGLFELSETVIDPAQQIAQNPCTKGFGSSFTIIGRGGIPTDPKKILSSDNVRVDLVKPSTTTNSITVTVDQPSKSPTVKRIIPAQGWIYNEKGEVLLVGYDPTKTGPQRQPQTPASSCAAVR